MNLLDLRVIAAVALVVGIACLGSYIKGWHDADKRAQDHIAAVQLAASERARATEQANANHVQDVVTRYEQRSKAQAAELDRVRYGVASGAVRLSIPAATCPTLPDPAPVASAAVAETRCEIDRDAAATLIDIARQGDEAIERANALIDFYEGLKK